MEYPLSLLQNSAAQSLPGMVTMAQKEQKDERRTRHAGFAGSDPADSLRPAWKSCYLRASGQRDAMQIDFGSSRVEIKKFVL